MAIIIAPRIRPVVSSAKLRRAICRKAVRRYWQILRDHEQSLRWFGSRRPGFACNEPQHNSRYCPGVRPVALRKTRVKLACDRSEERRVGEEWCAAWCGRRSG